jgi:putative ABC transport system permease protein
MTGLIGNLVADARHGWRLLSRARGFTAAALAVLALTIGANAAVFSVVNAVLLRPLPYRGADRIVEVVSTTRAGRTLDTSIPKFNAWRDSQGVHRVLQSLAAFQATDPGISLTGGDTPEHLSAMHVSADYFDVFGASLVRGRRFTAVEDRPHGPSVVILSHGLWVRRFGSDPAIVGQTIPLGGVGHEVVGVLAPDFTPEPPIDVYLPLQAEPFSLDFANVVRVVARLGPGASLMGAARAVSGTAPEFRRKFPLAMAPFEDFSVISLRDALVGDVSTSLQLLTGAVAFVLVIGCANVANLLLARGHRRRREIAIRAALGAGRGRIAAQLLTESALLAAAGGALGLTTAWMALRVVLLAGADALPGVRGVAPHLPLDSHVVLFTMAISTLTGVLFGTAPAVAASKVDATAAFRNAGSSGDVGWRRGRLQPVLVSLEVMLALVLLAGSGLMLETLNALRNVDPGFDARRVLAIDTSLSGSMMNDTEAIMRAYRNARQRLDGRAGVVRLAVARSLPLEPSFALPFTIDRRPGSGPFEGTALWSSVSDGYFAAFRMRVVGGRDFTEVDQADSPPVVIVNEALVRRFWQRNDPLGERITVGVRTDPALRDRPRRIVGVIADARDAGGNRDPEPMVYVPMAQVTDAMTRRNNRLFPITWIIRTSVEPRLVAPSVERELRSSTGGLPGIRVRTMEEILAGPVRRAAFSTRLLTAFATMALLLAVVGVYGVMSYSVQQRTQELGIRMALGAAPGDVRWMVLGEGLRLTSVGLVLGVVSALVLTRLMTSVVVGVSTYDPGVLAAVAALLGTTTVVAAFLPAHRATRINPLDAVREG